MMVVVLLLVRKPRELLVLIPPAAIWAIWWLTWSSGSAQVPGASVVPYGLAASRVIGETILVSAAGPGSLVVPIILLMAIVASVRGWRPTRWTVAGLAGLVVLYASIGLRGGWLPVAAEPSRYRYVGMALLLVAAAPVAGQLLASVPADGRRHRAAVVGLTALLAIPLALGVVGFPHVVANYEFWSLHFRAQAQVVDTRRGQEVSDVTFDDLPLTVSVYRSVMERWGPPRYNAYTLSSLRQKVFVAAAQRMSSRLSSMSPVGGAVRTRALAESAWDHVTDGSEPLFERR